MGELEKVLQKQKEFYRRGKTKDINFRLDNLKKLKEVIKRNEEDILEALKKDLSKSFFEGYSTEVGIVYDEINYQLKHLRKFMKREREKSSIIYFPSKTYIYKEPYGVSLIIGPFNYPFQLILAPLVGAIAAGNCAIIKPSEYSINTSKVLEKILNEAFNEEYIKVVEPEGGRETVSELLTLNFDYIFFTGSVMVGKIVMEAASKKLIPVTLELGGKSPCIIDEDANLELSAKRIVWGKLLNAGQTCVAPDYLFVNKKIKEKFLKLLVKEIKDQYGEDIKKNCEYPRIIRERDIERLSGYLKDGNIYFGGEFNIEEKYMMPTILTDVSVDSKVMTDEIFGPIFPVLEFDDLKNVINFVNDRDKPLALYYFSESKEKIEYVLNNTTSGGVTINDTVLQAASKYAPFGGVGCSGMGAYHGKASFYTFTHRKTVIKRGTFIEFPLRFAPFGDRINLVRKIMK
ncbi:aldehyde dehydrogenase [Eubacterium multiforme]|uniref:Aldehyde dehydrogenase n=1 Tax=Eubacterium multiforme TaxID=83339 RepID=A0ABT9UUH7_9FIRM|nr:aldehyde dehydrogenase [Eubacterium multiforme]MDQ0149952.1 aldehyde dehydrogenase (NAD+) [Eubacterium multiforme]